MQTVIWDRFIRCFHWSVAVLFLLNYWWLEAGEDAHEWAGYAIAVLVCARIVWGFVGPPSACFVVFVPSPSRLRQYLRSFPGVRQAQVSHNPLGALMVLFLMFMLLLVAVSGWMQDLDAFWGEDWVQNLHAISADILQGAVVVHVLAVLIMQRVTRVPLIRAMLTGKHR